MDEGIYRANDFLQCSIQTQLVLMHFLAFLNWIFLFKHSKHMTVKMVDISTKYTGFSKIWSINPNKTISNATVCFFCCMGTIMFVFNGSKKKRNISDNKYHNSNVVKMLDILKKSQGFLIKLVWVVNKTIHIGPFFSGN